MRTWLLAATTLATTLIALDEARAAGCAFTAGMQPPAGTPHRGVNLTGPPEKLRPHDVQEIRAIGLDHVRLPIDPATVQAAQSGDQASATRMEATVRLACDALRAGLLVILDMHPATPDLTLTDANAAQAIPRLAAAWAALGRHFAGFPASGLLVELLNEPQVKDPVTWDRAQAVLLAAARTAFPGSAPILTASPFDTAVALEGLKPVPDADALYTFHLYSPLVFTHQGASWSMPPYAEVKGLTFPPDARNAADVAARVANPAVRQQVLDYAATFGGPDPLGSRIGPVARWAHANGVRVVATELGVIANAPEASRAAWLGQARHDMEAAGIGWTVWEWRGGFRIAGTAGHRCQAELPFQALGLCR